MKQKNRFKNLLLVLSALTLLGACKKNEDSTPTADTGNNNNTGIISDVPSSFSQKVLIEQYTGAWNGGCPDGIYRMDQQIGLNSSKVIGVNIHMGDAMEIPLFNSSIAAFNNNNLPQFPSALVNRVPSLGNVVLSKTQWASNITVNLNKTAKCGLAIKSSVTSNTATVEIHTGYRETLTGNYSLTVYLVEDGVKGTASGYDQVNTNSSNDPASPYYNLSSPIVGFQHNSVVRKVLTSDLGDPLNTSLMVAGGEEIKKFSVSVSEKDLTKLRIVAFVSQAGSTSTSREILNVQSCSINNLKNWD